MKKLFIYYSRSGNGDYVVSRMSELGYDIRKVEAKRSLPKSFFWSMMIGGMLAGMNHKAKLKDFDYDVSSYDEIVIGSPIWNGKFACPINSLLDKLDLKKKKLRFIIYSGGGDSPKCIAKIKKNYSCDVYEIKEPKKYKDRLKEVLVSF